ncbi:MAG: hypothetical protein RL328_1491, partial [Acidobacteriota bacterium]
MFSFKFMILPRVLCAAVALSPLLSSSLLGADLSSYRGFKFGSSVAVAVKNGELRTAEVRIVHQQPALIQELDWQPSLRAVDGKTDSVREGLLSFLNGQLYRIVITYDRYQVEGMTADDMIEGISRTYGAATRPKAEIPYISNYGKIALVIARWEDSSCAYDLIRTGDNSTFAMVMYSKILDPLARSAIAEGV